MESDHLYSAPSNDQEGENYRPLSLLAIVTFVLGVFSSLSLVYLGAGILAVMTVLLGMFALRALRKDDRLTGVFPAMAGICLAMLFVSWGFAKYYVDRWIVYREAEVIARQWLDWVLVGEQEMAHQATLNPAVRQPSTLSVDDYYQMDEKARLDKEKLFGSGVPAQLLGLGKETQVRLKENVTQDVPLGEGKLVQQIYEITPTGKEPILAEFSITREYRKQLGRTLWIVAEVKEPGSDELVLPALPGLGAR